MTVLALTIGDIHLCHTPPVARSGEKDWYRAMERVLEQVNDLAKQHNAPVLCSGDVFDRWASPPELINFALSHLPHMHGIPGQHDLPNHRHDEMHRSAYGTLVRAGKIVDLKMGAPVELYGTGIRLWGFPWGYKVRALPEPGSSLHLELALVHAYVWTRQTGFFGAPEEKRLGAYLDQLRGYHVAVFGDNHQGFLSTGGPGETIVLNGGCLIPRKRDERTNRPVVGLIHADGTVSRHCLDTSEDVWLEAGEIAEKIRVGSGLEAFVEELNALGDQAANFESAVRRRLEKEHPPEPVKRMVLEALEAKVTR